MQPNTDSSGERMKIYYVGTSTLNISNYQHPQLATVKAEDELSKQSRVSPSHEQCTKNHEN